MFLLSALAGYEVLILRFTVAVVFIYHGFPKLLKPKTMAIPVLPAPLVGAVELLSGLALLAGRYTQYAALALIVVMLGALYFKIFRWKVPFSARDATGWEFDLVLLAANIVIFLQS